MIFDSLKNIASYKGINTNLDTAIDFILNHDLSSLPLTSKEVINDKVYYFNQEYICKEEKDLLYEIHKNHFDIQIILKGRELMKCFSAHDTLIPHDEYDPKKDFQYFEQKDGAPTFNAPEGFFAIFLPGEYHMPSIKVNEQPLRKIVFKISK